jgi:hypothetical protein
VGLAAPPSKWLRGKLAASVKRVSDRIFLLGNEAESLPAFQFSDVSRRSGFSDVSLKFHQRLKVVTFRILPDGKPFIFEDHISVGTLLSGL